MNAPVLDVLEVARAAAVEVGLDPTRIQRNDDPSLAAVLVTWTCPDEPHLTLYLRATWLAAMATQGSDALVRCPTCSPAHLERPRCTPVRDVLIGRRCAEGQP